MKNNVLELIGNTPLIRLKKIEEKHHLPFFLYAKLERNNPSGSVKDRAALYIIKDALDKKEINRDTMIIEATSGNTGISLAMICAYLDLKITVVMPESASIERRKIMNALGAKLVLTPASLGMDGAVNMANEIHRTTKNSFLTKQFDNSSNVNAHYLGTSKEILSVLGKIPDIFIATAGTSGTLVGCAKRFKEMTTEIKIYGIEPESSPLITKGYARSTKIQGIGPNFKPGILNLAYIDDFITVSDDDAYYYAKELAKVEGLFCGISSGAALAGVINLLKNREELKGKNVVTIFPDNGERYLSVEGLYE